MNSFGKIVAVVNLEKLIEELREKKITVAAAESCSGGYLSYLLTKVPGSSCIFKGGIVVYSLSSKAKFFQIPKAILEKSQGVSKNIATLLAKRVKRLFYADIGASIVGFAGPISKKGIQPGTVFVALAYKNSCWAKKLVIRGSRDTVRKRVSWLAIEMIKNRIKGSK